MRSQFLTGVALHLQANGVGVWNEDGGYTVDQLGIVHAARPASPANVISLTAYGVTDDPSLSDSTLGLQVWVRRDSADPRQVAGTADAIYDILHGAHDFRLPAPAVGEQGVWVVQCLRRSQTPGGQDDNQRWSDIQNFYVDVHYPSTNRI